MRLTSLAIPLILLAAVVGCSVVGCSSRANSASDQPNVLPDASSLPIGLTETGLSPDRRRLVHYEAARDTKGFHIFVSNADGSNSQQITHSPASEADASWSPDGNRIIFVRAARYRPYSMGGMVWDRYDIWAVKPDGGDEKRLTSENFYQAGGPHFSPDQRQVLFWAYREPPHDALQGQPGGEDIVIADLNENGSLMALRWMPTTPGPDGRSFFSALNRDPSYSPDGATIAFISNRVGRVSPYDYEVWLTDPAFSRMVQLTHLHSRLSSPTFTRDGQYIFFTDQPLVDSALPLWRMKPDGSDLKRLR
jgi:Tol biopolymer transport system component